MSRTSSRISRISLSSASYPSTSCWSKASDSLAFWDSAPGVASRTRGTAWQRGLWQGRAQGRGARSTAELPADVGIQAQAMAGQRAGQADAKSCVVPELVARWCGWVRQLVHCCACDSGETSSWIEYRGWWMRWIAGCLDAGCPASLVPLLTRLYDTGGAYRGDFYTPCCSQNPWSRADADCSFTPIRHLASGSPPSLQCLPRKHPERRRDQSEVGLVQRR